jgi:hypothetical protein
MNDSNSKQIRTFLNIELSKPIVIKKGHRFQERIEWLLPNGIRHRDFGPAVIWKSGKKIWYQYGKIHRADGPAIEHNGVLSLKEWFFHDLKHRDNGPAVESINENQWWVHGKLHRVNGPAIDGTKKEYWLNGKKQIQYKKAVFNLIKKVLRLKP